jgi:hypothetical protein
VLCLHQTRLHHDGAELAARTRPLLAGPARTHIGTRRRRVAGGVTTALRMGQGMARAGTLLRRGGIQAETEIRHPPGVAAMTARMTPPRPAAGATTARRTHRPPVAGIMGTVTHHHHGDGTGTGTPRLHGGGGRAARTVMPLRPGDLATTAEKGPRTRRPKGDGGTIALKPTRGRGRHRWQLYRRA